MKQGASLLMISRFEREHSLAPLPPKPARLWNQSCLYISQHLGTFTFIPSHRPSTRAPPGKPLSSTPHQANSGVRGSQGRDSSHPVRPPSGCAEPRTLACHCRSHQGGAPAAASMGQSQSGVDERPSEDVLGAASEQHTC